MQFRNLITGEMVTPTDWQRQLAVGDYYMIARPVAAAVDLAGTTHTYDDMPAIYGQIIDNEGCQPGFFWVRAYSELCPHGESGQMNICEPTRKLTAEEFAVAQARGWKEQSPPAATLDDYLKTLDICRAALAGIGADAPPLVARLSEISDILREHHQQIGQAIDDLLVSARRDPILHQLEVRQAVLALATALEPDERYDPADDPREEQAVTRLAHLLGGLERARGVSEALHLLRYPPQPGEDGTGTGPVLAA